MSVSSAAAAAIPKPADAFEALFRAEYPRVVAIARRVLADGEEAEDVAQEVFVAFHHRHRADAAFAAAWLHRAAAHEALNALRGKRRRTNRERAHAPDERDAAIDPQQAVEAAERRAEVRAALGRLRPRSAEVLALRYGGLSYAEVASAMDVGVGQIGTLLRRAEAALREEMTHDPHR